jgi:hypothetical protein
MRTLGAREGLIIIDEIQRKPELFEILRVLVDRPNARSRFLILGHDWVHPGRVSPWNRCLPPLASAMPGSGRPTAARSWIED